MSDDPMDLIHAYLDGELSEDEQRRLVDWLEESPANLEQFVTDCQVHSELFDIHCRPSAELLADALQAAPADIHHSSFIIHHVPLFGGVPLAYAVTVLILGMGLVAARVWQAGGEAPRASVGTSLARGAPARLPYVARLSGTDNCRWAAPQMIARDGEAVPLGRKLAISEGLLGITYSNGARVTLAGPAVYVVDSPRGGFLSFGTVSVCIQPRGQGVENLTRKEADGKSEVPDPRAFCVRTAAGRFSNRNGGEFRVKVDESGGSWVFVLEGTVTSRSAAQQGGFLWKHGRHRGTTVASEELRKGHSRHFPAAEGQRGEQSVPGT